jgi:hypothetical protein
MRRLLLALVFVSYGSAIAQEPSKDVHHLTGSGTAKMVEAHVFTLPDDNVYQVYKLVGSYRAPGLFDSMVGTDIGAGKANQRGEGDWEGSWLGEAPDGTLRGTYTTRSTASVDDKGVMKGSYHCIMQVTGGTGRYANVRGTGQCDGQFTGSDYTETWSIDVSGVDRATASR